MANTGVDLLCICRIISGMSYREDYEKAASELEKLLEQSEKLDEKILATRKRMVALATLMGVDEFKGNRLLPSDSRSDKDYARTQAVVQSRISDYIRRIMGTGRAFTTREIRAELEQLGFNLMAHANPLATINAVCASLVESGELRRVEKHGRIAWERVKGAA